jgi:hypothetical protein
MPDTVATIMKVNVSAPGQPSNIQDVEIRTVYGLLDLIRVRPGMWIGVPSVTRLSAFIDGFRTGVRVADYALDAESPPFQRFHDWVAVRHDGRRSNGRGWPEVLLDATERNEETAFNRFWIELDAFRASGT